MKQESVQLMQRQRFRKPVIMVSILLGSVGLCCLLFHCSPLGWLYVGLNAENIYEQAMEAAPEFDKLNDDLMQSLPVYPRATSLPQSPVRSGPGPYAAWFLDTGPSGPRRLSVYFATDDSMEQVAAFYHHTLQADGWKPVRTVFAERYTKNQACIDLDPIPGFESDARTFYEVSVFYDLNVLLPFPGLPKVWDGGVDRCP